MSSGGETVRHSAIDIERWQNPTCGLGCISRIGKDILMHPEYVKEVPWNRWPMHLQCHLRRRWLVGGI